ncbi:MAG: hypothetical protein EOP04_22120 [Proteobacteria bacterium]|nr:MAG: hypothetical protein EOP04_22120 [Pseudomonadota bacterium]
MSKADALNTNIQNLSQGSSIQSISTTASQFAAYARKHDRADIAAETLQYLKPLMDFVRQKASSESNSSYFLRYEGALAQITMSWIAAILARSLGTLSLGLWIGFSIFGPIRPARNGEISQFGPRVVYYPVALGVAISFVTGIACLAEYCEGQTSANPSNSSDNYALAAVLLPIALITITCFGATLWAVFKARSPRSERKRRMTFREIMSLSPWRRMANILFLILNFLAFRGLPVLILFFLQFLVLALLEVKVPRGFFGDFELYLYGLRYSLEDVSAMSAWLASSLFAYFIAAFIRWRFDMPQSLRPTIYAGFFAYRRALAWIIPLSVWFYVAAIAFGVAPRAKLEAQISDYLYADSEI